MKRKLLLSLLLLLVVRVSWGQVMFQKIISADSGCAANAVRQTSDGGYIITGTITPRGATAPDVYLAKTDPDGNLTWSKNFGGSR